MSKWFSELIKEAKKNGSYWIESAKLDFTEELFALMEKRNISKGELATLIGRNQAYITRVMQCDAKFTIETMVRLVHALGGELKIGIKDRETTDND